MRIIKGSQEVQSVNTCTDNQNTRIVPHYDLNDYFVSLHSRYKPCPGTMRYYPPVSDAVPLTGYWAGYGFPGGPRHSIHFQAHSMKEDSLYRFIKENYTGDIRCNDRDVLHGKEIDIYLPELHYAIEFDGTYWHADPRFYKSTDLIMGRSAGKIWERDRLKERLCRIRGIKLIRVKEYDWDHDTESIKNKILEIIR